MPRPSHAQGLQWGWGIQELLMLPQTKLGELPPLWGMLSQHPPFTFLLEGCVYHANTTNVVA